MQCVFCKTDFAVEPKKICSLCRRHFKNEESRKVYPPTKENFKALANGGKLSTKYNNGISLNEVLENLVKKL
jgi:hypothetical protein